MYAVIELVSVSDNMSYCRSKWRVDQMEPVFGTTSDGNNPYYRRIVYYFVD